MVFPSFHRKLIQTVFQEINFGNKLFTRLPESLSRGSRTCHVISIFCVVLKNVSGSFDSSFTSVFDG